MQFNDLNELILWCFLNLQEFSTLEAEIEELKASIDVAQQEQQNLLSSIKENEALLESSGGELEAAKEAVREMRAKVAQEKERLNKQNKEMHQMGQRKDKLLKEQSDRELEMKKLKHATDKIRVQDFFLYRFSQMGVNVFKIGASRHEKQTKNYGGGGSGGERHLGALVN